MTSMSEQINWPNPFWERHRTSKYALKLSWEQWENAELENNNGQVRPTMREEKSFYW